MQSFSLCRDNLGWHPTTIMDRPTHRRTSLVAHLIDDFLLVVIVRLVWETCPELMFVKNLCLRVGNTYIGETWYEHRHVCENLWDLWFLWYMWSLLCIWWLCDICDVYVMIMWYIFCLFGWNRINKLKKGYSGHFAECNTRQRGTLPSAKVRALGKEGTPGHW
jgi:hypothetical protein